MAGHGPPPAENRRRRNEPARGDWVELDPLTETILPDLPKRLKKEGNWSARTIAAWRAWQKDPVTQMWSESDIAYAQDTILLHDRMTPSIAKEVRLRMDGLGLTPKGKRDHRWKVAVPEAEPVKASRQKSKSSSKRRARLSVVPDPPVEK